MRRADRWTLVALLALAAAPVRAQPPSAEERKRRELLRELGLDKRAAPAPAPTSSPEQGADAPPALDAPAERPSAPAPARPAVVPFVGAVHDALLGSCKTCHVAGGPAGSTRFVLGAGLRADWAAARAVVERGRPATSRLVTKAAGNQHGGGVVFASGSTGQRLMTRWIATGAELDAPAASDPVAAAPAAPKPPARRRPPPPAASVDAPTASVVEPVDAPASTADEPQPAAPAAPADAIAEAHAVLVGSCAACHTAGGPAGTTRLVLTQDRQTNLTVARAFVDTINAPASPLVAKATGHEHGGGAVLPPEDARTKALLAWIAAGAPVAPTAAASTVAAAPASVVSVAPTAAPPPPPVAHPHAAGVALPGELRLNGRFDLNYERRNFQNQPFSDGATSALRSYHHFVFLSRESTSDSFGFTAELVDLTFWEAHVRFAPAQASWRGSFSAGKLLVPFGTEPLFHQSYGGLVGFDQRVLPPVWAQEGAALHVSADVRGTSLTLDLYAVRGYRLKRADDVLNLQADFATNDDVRFGLGQRAGLWYGPVGGWYSAYVNPLGFGRTLVMQAMDVGVARLRGVPVANRFTFAAGLLRADVSGGGAGRDYYHFASYLQLRFFPTEWLYLQYRQGLRTFNNRRGVIGDNTRWTPDDGSTHNFGMVARLAGASVGLTYFFLLEKADEIPNDFLRLMVAYEF